MRCDVMGWGKMWCDVSWCDVIFYKLANTYLQVIQVLTYLLFSFCSPSQGLCCSAGCTPQNNAFLCLNETECSNSSYCKYPLWICVSLQVMYKDQNISGLLSCKNHLKNYYGSAPWWNSELVGRWTQHFTKIDEKTRKIGQSYLWNPMTTGFIT